LAAVLHRSATLPVQDATPGERLQPGRILLAPADHHLLVEPDGRVALSTAARVQLVRPAADVLFASVAPVFTTRVIAVVLTGWGSDGTQGIQRVKHWGGTVIAQDEASSEVFEMPRSAIATGAVNCILSLEAIAPALVATVATLTQASTPIWDSRRNRRHAQHDMTPQTPGTPSPAQGLLPAWAGSPLAGQDSHLLDDEQSFMETSHPPIPFDQPCLVALKFLYAMPAPTNHR
jgi:hypothetical protein